MSNETKQELFNDLVEELANAYSDLDGEGIGEELTNEEKQAYLKDYDAALPDDLPVLPKVVGKFIKAMKANGDSLFASESTVLLMEYLGLIPFDALKINEWIDKHQNTVARAWLLETWAVAETGEIVKLEAEK